MPERSARVADRYQAALVEVDQCEVGAARGEALGHRGAEPSAGARDQDRFAAKLHASPRATGSPLPKR